MNNLLNVRLKTYSELEFLNYIHKSDLEIYNFNVIQEYEYGFQTTFRTYKKLKKRYNELKIEKSNSIKILFLKTFSEKLVLICLLISSLFYIYLSRLIINVNVEGTSSYLNKYLENELKEYNLSKYQFIPDIKKIKEIEKEIYLENLDKFELLNIVREGVNISVHYQVKKKNLILDEVKNKIYSKKDAIISKILISSGNLLVKENQFVKKDQLLVDDHILINDEPYFIGTKGIIYGITYNKVDIEYNSFEEGLLEARYLVSKRYIKEEKIIEEKIIYHDEITKKLIIHYKCEEILNSF